MEGRQTMNASISHIQKAFIKFAINIWMEWRGDLCQRTFSSDGEMNAPNAGLPHKSAEANRLMAHSSGKHSEQRTDFQQMCCLCVLT